MKSSSRCLVCNHTVNGSSGDTYVNIFSSSSPDGNGTLASRLEAILQVRLELASCHTSSLCQRCHTQVTEIEGYYRIIDEFRNLYHETARFYKQEESRPEDLNSLIDTGLLELEKLLGIDHDDPSVQALLKAESSYRHDSETEPHNAGNQPANAVHNDVSCNPTQPQPTENDAAATGCMTTRRQSKKSATRSRSGRFAGAEAKASNSQKTSQNSKQLDDKLAQTVLPSTCKSDDNSTEVKHSENVVADGGGHSETDARGSGHGPSSNMSESQETQNVDNVVTDSKLPTVTDKTADSAGTCTATPGEQTDNQSTDGGATINDTPGDVADKSDDTDLPLEVKVTPATRKRRHNHNEVRTEPMSLRKRPPRQAALRASKRYSTSSVPSQTATPEPPAGDDEGIAKQESEIETLSTSVAETESVAKKTARLTEDKEVKNSEVLRSQGVPNPYNCSSCSEAFRTRHDFYRHIRTCGKAYQQPTKPAAAASASHQPTDHPVSDEKGKVEESQKGTVAMATNSGIPDSSSSQKDKPDNGQTKDADKSRQSGEEKPTVDEKPATDEKPAAETAKSDAVTNVGDKVSPPSVDPSHITNATKQTENCTQGDSKPEREKMSDKGEIKEDISEGTDESKQNESGPGKTMRESNKSDNSNEKVAMASGESFSSNTTPGATSSSYATNSNASYLGVVGPPTTLEDSQRHISLHVRPQQSPPYNMAPRPNGPQSGGPRPNGQRQGGPRPNGPQPLGLSSQGADPVGPMQSPPQPLHAQQRPLAGGMYNNYPRPPAYGAPHGGGYMQQERSFGPGGQQRQMRPPMMGNNNFGGNRAAYMPPAPPYGHPSGHDPYHMQTQQHIQHMHQHPQQDQHQQHFQQLQGLPQSQPSPLGDNPHPGQPPVAISNGPQYHDNSLSYMDPSANYRPQKGTMGSPQSGAPGQQRMYPHPHSGGFMGASPPPQQPHPDGTPSPHHVSMVPGMASPGGHGARHPTPHHPRLMPHSSPSSHQGAANFANQHQGMGHQRSPQATTGIHPGGAGHQGSPQNIHQAVAPQNMQHQVAPHNISQQGGLHNTQYQGAPPPQNMQHQMAPPQNMPHQAPPHNMSHRVNPPNLQHHGAPHNVQHQGAPHNVQHQGAPQNMQHQGAPQNMQHQGAPPNLQHQGAPPNLQHQGAPPNMQHQGAPPNMQHQGAPPNMQHQGAPPNMQHQGAPQNLQHQGAPQNLQHQGAPPNMQHQGATQNLQPQGAPPNMQHQGAPQNLQPQGAPPNMQHQGATQNLHHQGAPQNLQPQGAPPNMQHQGALQNLQHQGASQNLPHQGAPQNLQHQGAPQNLQHQGAPPNMQHQGAPQNLQHQGAPPNMQHQGAPPNMQHQGAPQNLQHQGAPQNLQHQGAPQNLQHQGPPQNVQHQGAPQNVQHQGTVQNMQHPGGGHTMQHPGTVAQNMTQPAGQHSMSTQQGAPPPLHPNMPLQHPQHAFHSTNSTPPAQSSHSPHQGALGGTQHPQPPPQSSQSVQGTVPSQGTQAKKPGSHFGVQPPLQHSQPESGQFKPPQDSGFPCASALVNLAKTHTEPKPYKCTICDASFFNSDLLMDHVRVHNEEGDHAEDVDRSSSNATPASKEVSPQPSPSPRPKKERTKSKEKSWRCAKCNITCMNAEDWAEHRKSHMGEKAYHCPTCGVAFAAKWYLTRHQRTHSGEKPHKCDICGKAFGRPDHLRKHVTIHSTKPNCVVAL